MKWLLPCFLMHVLPVCGQAVDPAVMLDVKTRPASIQADELEGLAELQPDRRQLVETALKVAATSPWLPYLVDGADPAAGGFDCSGAMYFVMRKAGYDPPRSSGGQMEWLKKSGRFQVVPPDARDLKHASFAALKPGDLMFWARTGAGGELRVHHVEMYLGTEKMDGRPVTIGSTDGRSYRGQKANGYGVHDLRVPGIESASKLIGYGTPPVREAD
jgi:cell wall-associated NlpC family hydrolase